MLAHEKKWSALSDSGFPCTPSGNAVTQQAAEEIKSVQTNDEHICIKDSCDVTVTTTDTQAAVNLQIAI